MLLGVSNFLQTFFYRIYVRIPAKYGVCGSTGLDATPTVQIHICHPVVTFGQLPWDIPYLNSRCPKKKYTDK